LLGIASDATSAPYRSARGRLAGGPPS